MMRTCSIIIIYINNHLLKQILRNIIDFNKNSCKMTNNFYFFYIIKTNLNYKNYSF